MTELLAALVRANLAGSLVVLLVLAARRPMRRLFGAQAAYGLWAAPPLAVVAALLPAMSYASPDAPPAPLSQLPGLLGATGLAPALAGLWLAGAVLSAALMGWAQLRFLRQARAGRAGPAVVGVLNARILMPADDGRYTADERALVRAHEREHIARADPQAGALAAALQCLAWFNPLAHLAAHLMRLDQELACDAATLRRFPCSRRRYAEALLKTQLARTPLPFGCYWPARSLHPLEMRIGLLKAARPRHELAGWLMTGFCVLVVAGVISTAPKPARVAIYPDPAPHMVVVLVDITPRPPAR